jgi:anti-sigma regulatory factor (Ser/Thr protein kinase)
MENQLEMHRVIPVIENSNVGQVRRAIQEFAARLGAGDDISSRAALVATELSTNLIKHSSGGGEILYRALSDEPPEFTAIEILSIDNGPGIPNISRAFNDGFSTAGSPGTGLGAIQRMSDALEIYSADKHGVVINAQIRARTGRKFAPPRIRSVYVPLDGFEISGDYGLGITRDSILSIILCDGLGHGEEAAIPSHLAAEIFRENVAGELPAIMELIHKKLVNTRGAAVALARFDPNTRILKYVAVGNIDARFCTDDYTQGFATLNGTAGRNLPRLHQFQYQIPPGSLVVMHTDGLSGRWNLQDYPAISLQAPGAVAALLYRDFARKRDDATILSFSL